MNELGRIVHRKIVALQAAYRGEYGKGRKSDAVATLAKLRRGVGKEPGSIPEIWDITLSDVPSGAGSRTNATYDETAAHVALTLYAVHQQSKSDPMHRPGVGLGAALRELRRRPGAEEPIRRRFEALGTSLDVNEASYHARGLITLLRAKGIGVDYAQLAQDLKDLQFPDGAQRVRLRWGRDFYGSSSNKGEENQSEGEG